MAERIIVVVAGELLYIMMLGIESERGPPRFELSWLEKTGVVMVAKGSLEIGCLGKD